LTIFFVIKYEHFCSHRPSGFAAYQPSGIMAQQVTDKLAVFPVGQPANGSHHLTFGFKKLNGWFV